MPNWSYNTIAIKGNKNSVINFLNDGLKTKNLFVEEITEKTQDLFVEMSLRSWMPMPQIFEDYDTTNELPELSYMIRYRKELLKRKFPNDYEEIIGGVISPELMERLKLFYETYKVEWEQAKETQKREYGIVGWYDYNLATLGTKWDADIENFRIKVGEDGKVTIIFSCETAWNMPMGWLQEMVRRYPSLHFLVYGEEESSSYVGYYDVNEDRWIEEVSDTISAIYRNSEDYQECAEEAAEYAQECYFRFSKYICDME